MDNGTIVVPSKVINTLESYGDEEYLAAKRLVEELFKDKATRFRFYLAAAAHRKIEDIERLRDISDTLERRISSGIEKLDMDDAISAFKIMTELQQTHMNDFKQMIELIGSGL